MDVELDIGGLDPAVVGENFIEGDTSICAGYFTDEEEMLVAPEEQGQGCYGSRFEKDGTVSGAYFGNCLKDFWLSADILIIRGHFLIYSDKKTKAVVGVRPSFLDSNGNRYSGDFLSVSPPSSPPTPDLGVVVDVDAVGVEIRLDSGVGRNKRKGLLAGFINLGRLWFTPKAFDPLCPDRCSEDLDITWCGQ